MMRTKCLTGLMPSAGGALSRPPRPPRHSHAPVLSGVVTCRLVHGQSCARWQPFQHLYLPTRNRALEPTARCFVAAVSRLWASHGHSHADLNWCPPLAAIQQRRSPCSTGGRSPAPTATLFPVPAPWRRLHSFQGQSHTCADGNTARCPQRIRAFVAAACLVA
jgi:hypothetical protein